MNSSFPYFQLGLVSTVVLIAPYLLYYLYIRQRALSATSESASRLGTPMISVLICTLNAAETVEKKLANVLHQTYPPKNIEVIVVDGGSTDDTLKILHEMRDQMNEVARFIIVENTGFRGKASQINAGFRLATGDYVVTTDADCELNPDSLRILVESLSEDGVGAVCARQVLANPNHNAITRSEVTYRRFYEVLRMGESSLRSTPVYHGGLSAYRKEAYAPIDEDVNADDTQLALAAIRMGFRALYEPRSTFGTRSPLGFRDGIRQRIRRGQGLQRVFWRNRDMISPWRFGAFGFPIFATEFYMHIISPLLFVAASASLLAYVISLSFVMPIVAAPIIALAAFFLYWNRNSVPVVFVTSFAFYQLVLFGGMFLHLLGYNYAQWSRK